MSLKTGNDRISMKTKEIERHHYFMGIAYAVREKANCLGSRVGAVIVQEQRIISTGYNGTPSGMPNCLEGGCYRCAHRQEFASGSGYDLCICVHAEQNALLAAARFGIAVGGGTIYSTLRPCFGCLKEMLQAKINAVYYVHDWTPSERTAAQYSELQKYFGGGVHKLEIIDPRADWAVAKLRDGVREHSELNDETGHLPS